MTTATRPTYRIDYRDNEGHAQTINMKGYKYEDAKWAARRIARETSEAVEITMVLPGFERVVWNSRQVILSPYI